jgi:hypothetical protein
MFISGSTLESQFWEMETDVPSEWELMWNVNGTQQDGSVPVTLKITGPTA